MDNKKLYKKYDVAFERSCGLNHVPADKPPIDTIHIGLWAENVKNAIDLAWQSVTCSPEQYEIVGVTTDNHRWRTYREDE